MSKLIVHSPKSKLIISPGGIRRGFCVSGGDLEMSRRRRLALLFRRTSRVKGHGEARSLSGSKGSGESQGVSVLTGVGCPAGVSGNGLTAGNARQSLEDLGD